MLGTFTSQENIPFFLHHNQKNILLFADLIAASFAFVLGASLFFSFKNRFASFNRKAAYRYSKRFVFIALLGFLLDGFLCIGQLTFCPRWGVLQSLGVAGLIAIPFLSTENNKVRFLGVLGLLILYQFGLYGTNINFGIEAISIHGGLIGGIGYGIVSIFGLISAQYFFGNRKNKIWAIGIALILAAVLLSYAIPFDKWTVSTSYVIISSGVSMCFWLLLDLLSKKQTSPNPVLFFLAKNSLLLWTLQYLIVWYPLAFIMLGGKFSFLESAVFSLILILIFYAVAQKLHKLATIISTV